MAKKEAQKEQQPKAPNRFRPILTHVGIILSFFIIVSLYFRPLYSGKVLPMSDIASFKGMSKEIVDFREEKGSEPLWASRMFSGMPAYQISVTYHKNFVRYVDRMLRFGIPRPANYIFLMFLGFYFLLITQKVNPYLSGIGALAFALSSYFFIILEPGHTSKANAIAYMAPTLAGILLALQGRYWLGGAITALFLSLEINANHFQITYYLGLTVLVLGIVYLIDAIRNKTVPEFGKAIGVLVLALVFALGPNLGRMWTTYEYGQETIRGRSEITTEDNTKNSGLDKEYALRWSYGVEETFTLLIPNFMGGATQTRVDPKSDLYRKARRTYQDQGAQMLSRTYWGDQPGTSGPVYVGAAICFLFILGLFVIKGKFKWWIVSATLLTIMLSWGRNFMPLTDLFFYNFPLYNKFRAVSILLVVAELTMPFFAILTLKKIIDERDNLDKNVFQRQLLISAGLTGGIALIFAIMPGVMSFSGVLDDQIYAAINRGQFPQDLFDMMMEQRKNMLQADAFRSVLIVSLVAGLVWLYVKDILKNVNVVYVGLAAIILFDMIPVNRRYLSSEAFVAKNRYESQFRPTQADKFILQDKDPNYRVLNVTTNTFNDAHTSYFHKHVGGYHAAKLRRYADLIDRYIGQETQGLRAVASSLNPNLPDTLLKTVFADKKIIHMLNTRYIITNPQAPPLRNPLNLGPAWFVENVQQVASPDEEIVAVGTVDLAKTAVVDARYAEQLTGLGASNVSGAKVSIAEYDLNRIVYNSESSEDAVAVFSEVYFNNGKGWNSYIDGEPVPHFRANYILRAMRVPAGKHTIEFRFEPKSYATGETIALIGSILLFLVVAGLGYMAWKEKDQE